jgi:hypothetical protein
MILGRRARRTLTAVSDAYPDSEQAAPEGVAGNGGPVDPRARLVFAAALAAALVAVVVGILLIGSTGGSNVPDAEPAPTACVDSWNESRRALRFGQHNWNAHNYIDVQVTYLTKDAELADADSGLCAVIFGRSTLDPEPGASGQVLLPNGTWLPISVRLGVEDRELQRLQVDALQQANAELQEDGSIVAVDV